jgi:hypothetical protein
MPSDAQFDALRLAQGLEPTAANLQRVARETDDEAARWAFVQWSLRSRAKDRFPHADRMLFVREALEQATHAGLAIYHSSLFPPGALVVDLTCGVGGDLVALAKRGPTLGFELDPERADYARWNLRTLGLEGEVREADGLTWLQKNQADYILADPARRVEGRRTLDFSQFSPHPTAVAEASRGARRWAMKLSPMLADETLRELAPRIEFVSFGGECREALLLGGTDGLEPGEWAVQPGLKPLPGGTSVSVEAAQPDAWFYDADPAAVRAHALGNFDLAALGDAPGYLTGSKKIESPWLRSYRVIDEISPKKLGATLKSMCAAAPILKQRGAKQDLDRWRKQLGRHGDRSVTVAFYLRGAVVRALVLE